MIVHEQFILGGSGSIESISLKSDTVETEI